MPARRFRKKGAIRRKRRGRRRVMKRGRIFRAMPGMPSRRVVRMRWSDTINMTLSNTALISAEAIMCNDINTPWTAVGPVYSHQPLGHDQWSAFYNSFVVVGAKIKCQCIVVNTTAVPLVWGLQLSDGNSILSPSSATYTQMIENGKSKYRYQQWASNGNVPAPLTMGFSAKKWFNIANVKDNVSRIGSQFSNTAGFLPPADVARWNVWAGHTGSGGSITPIIFVVSVDYIVVVSEPKELPQS